MNTRFLETLVWLARLKSFSKTAEKLNATQPAIWNRIAKLEESLGVPLYVHGTKEFVLTDAGRRILADAERLVDMSNNIVDLARITDERSGTVRIGVVELALQSWLSTFIDIVEERFPLVCIDLITEPTPFLVDALERGLIDIAVVFGPIFSPGVENVPAGRFPVRWIASPRHFDCQTPIDIVELSRLPLIAPHRSSSAHATFEGYFRSHGLSLPNGDARRVTLENTYSPQSTIHAVKAGLGISLLPPHMCADEIARRDIALLPVRQALPAFDITASYRHPARSIVVGDLARTARQAAITYAATVSDDYLTV